jgi:hypothetical protein
MNADGFDAQYFLPHIHDDSFDFIPRRHIPAFLVGWPAFRFHFHFHFQTGHSYR